jgi:nucleotide-binding universal stress UspA family protein
MSLGRDMLPSHLCLAVPPRSRGASRRFRRIIVCVDFSAECDDALHSVAAVAAGTEVMLDLVYVIDVFTEAFVQRSGGRSHGSTFAKETIKRALRDRLETLRASRVRGACSVLVGLPALALARHVNRTAADLVVLGSRRRERHAPPTWVGLAAARLFRDPGWRRLRLRPRGRHAAKRPMIRASRAPTQRRG